MPSSRTVAMLVVLALTMAGGVGYALVPETGDGGQDRNAAGAGAPVKGPDIDPTAAAGEGTGDLPGEIQQLRERIVRLEKRRTPAPPRLPLYPLPEALEFAGHRIPLERPEVRERLDYELLITLGRPAMPLLWLKRAGRVGPPIRSRLAEAGFPADLFYVAVAESDLRIDAVSPAGAVGLWQFLRSTGIRSGLRVDRTVDERRHAGRATEAAIRYLGELQEEFGDWLLAVAAYNAGERRVREAVEQQGERDYFSLFLPAETRRYAYRILAAKLVMEDPAAYGLFLPAARCFSPRPTREETVTVEQAREDLVAIARRLEVPYLLLRELNPQLRSSTLPRGTYRMTVLAREDPSEAPPAP
jgi:hypothetical protein